MDINQQMRELGLELEGEPWEKKDKRHPSAVALGSIKSKKKAKSSRENGKKGGRPKKSQ